MSMKPKPLLLLLGVSLLCGACRLFKTSTPAPKLASKPSVSYQLFSMQVVRAARAYTGAPYRSGGNGRAGIDCSGLICAAFADAGVRVPRVAWQQAEFGIEVVDLKNVRSGDWLFFVPENGKEGYVSHAGIVTTVKNKREIMFIHASSSRGVREDNLFASYFKNRFVKAMRPF